MTREYGSPAACWRRLRDWEEDGHWERVWRKLLALLDVQDKLEWSEAYLDGSFVRLKRGAAVGKIKRGKGIRVMLVADGEGLLSVFNWRSPIPRVKRAVPTLETVCVPRQGRGRPK